MRSTMSSLPHSGELLSTSGMPLCIMARPFALPHPEEAPIPVINNGTMGPVRCGRCKAYMNPYMRFLDHLRFECNFCYFVTEVPHEYMCNLGVDGKRTDWTERQELCRGSVEYVAPDEYMVRPPMAPTYVFLIEVTSQAIHSGVTTSACEVISRTLDNLPSGAQVGVATVDSTIHFYHLKEGAEKPSMLIVPDVDDSYAPLKSGLVVDLAKNRSAIDSLLKVIPETFSTASMGPNASTAGIKAAIECLKPTGGKVMAFLATIPNVGVGKVEARVGTAGQRTGNIEKEPLKCMAPANRDYTNMAMYAAENQVCVDLFLCVSSAVDVATLGVLPRLTGGSLYRYPGFNVQQDFAQLHNDLRWNFIRPQGLEAVMRVRASTGLGVQDYSGFFAKRTVADIDLAAIDSDKTIAVTLRYEDKLVDGRDAYVQCALLYTTTTRERRIRVHTIALPVTSVLGQLFRSADLDAQSNWAVRRAADKLLTGNGTLAAAKDASLQQCISTLFAYRKFCASNNSSGQLILPEGLKTLPLYTLGLHKSYGLRSDASPDDRAMWLYRALHIPSELSTPAVYPRLFSVHDLPQHGAFPPIPPCLWLSAEKLNQEGAYLLEDGQEILIWIGRQLPLETLRALFGTENIDEIISSRATLPVLDTVESKTLNAFVNAIRKQRGAFMRTRILKRGDTLETLFYNRLSEDRSPSGMSYVEFLCHCHRLIMNKSN
ncbi:protein transport protein Sec24-like CEF [Ostreococcus tauri]|uniref:Protein transport protein Sec24-like CEF n=1 Tax=Ostreococcus tauri TaxID=70448 RepID=A0A1Y5IA96_OSTTA|nr:protein transport protein Sec24-like CEF [Ostreococcus tauri]